MRYGTQELSAPQACDTAVGISDRAAAEGYVGKVCFKTGPPRRVGIELEWTVHHTEDPTRPLDPETLIAALGDHAPRTLRPDSPNVALPHGGSVTIEPGGQVEISTPPMESPAALIAGTGADIDHLTALLAQAGLRMGGEGCDPERAGRRILHTPRYDAMERDFTRRGLDASTMMCATAGLQVCLDVGEPDRVAARWRAAHALGPVMVAAFANSRRSAGHGLGWLSNRMHAWFGADPTRDYPSVAETADPIAAWARQVLDTPLLCVRRAGGCWEAPPGVTFAEWVDGALPTGPTFDDLDYHLTTVFPPVRARGYLELRYLDTQPGADWLAPVAVLTALFAREETVDAAAELAGPAATRWEQAARDGLTDPVIASVLPELLDLARGALADTDLPDEVTAAVAEQLTRRIRNRGLQHPEEPMSGGMPCPTPS